MPDIAKRRSLNKFVQASTSLFKRLQPTPLAVPTNDRRNGIKKPCDERLSELASVQGANNSLVRRRKNRGPIPRFKEQQRLSEHFSGSKRRIHGSLDHLRDDGVVDDAGCDVGRVGAVVYRDWADVDVVDDFVDVSADFVSRVCVQRAEFRTGRDACFVDGCESIVRLE